jgi:hypothetical protein
LGDFREANFLRADLRSATMQGSDCRNANFSGANLRFANLEGADLRGAIFDSADCSHAIMRGCNFVSCELFWTDLIAADLEGADFTKSLIVDSNLKNANLRATHFGKARVFRSNLDFTNLAGAWLVETELDDVRLNNVDFPKARLGNTRLCNLDLRTATGLESTHHLGPSSIGIETIIASQGKIPHSFLESVGVPKRVIESLMPVEFEPIEFYSCFISYSAKDQFFARNLYMDLRMRNIRCWLFEEDAKWGEKVWSEIDRSIKVHDKVIVVCSANSLQSEPVCREIERALQREDREKRDVLFPVRIDNYIFDGWEHHRKADVISKVVGDFSDPLQYQKSLIRLVEHLNKADAESETAKS